MDLVFFGTGSFGIPALESLKTSGHRILAIVTMKEKPGGRRLVIKKSPIKGWAVKNGFRVIEFTSEAAVTQELKALNADLFIVISFGLILSKQLLRLPRQMCLNVHSSLLPRHRGPAPIVWTLLNGDAETGVTVMRMTEKLDAGDILLQKKTAVLPEDDAQTLERRLGLAAAEALTESLRILESGRADFKVQDERKSSTAAKLKKQDGHIDWNSSAVSIQNRIRALSGWPGSFCFLNGKRLLVLQATAETAAEPKGAVPGTVLKASASEGIWVAAKDSVLRIRRLQLEGKKPLNAEDFLRGSPLSVGRLLE